MPHSPHSSPVEKLVIIGSGPAGWTAAIYAARANLRPLVLTGGGAVRTMIHMPGGQLMWTSEVENFPGFVHGISGHKLMDTLQQQAERMGARVRQHNVNKLDLSTRPFKIWHDGPLLGDDEVLTHAHTIIVATGAAANYLGLPSERQFENLGVSACAVCDGISSRGPSRDRPLVVVFGGKFGGGGGFLPDQICLAGIPGASARCAAGLEGDGLAGAFQSEGDAGLEFSRAGSAGKRDRGRHRRAGAESAHAGPFDA